LIELKTSLESLFATVVRIPGESPRLAYVSMDEAGIEWVNPEEVEGWRFYTPEEHKDARV
jgi:hypothetical protein